MLILYVLLFADQLQFTADHAKLMKTLVDSLYKNKEIFLRELLSNSADALDKYKLTALKKNQEVGDLEIRVVPNEELGTIEIIDNGIGMTRQELVDNLGTISKSGTSEFQAENANDKDLIGQFGVGFYSSFLVADRVDVISTSIKDKSQSIWSSDYSKGNGFTVEKDTTNDKLERGTRIILHLRKEAKSFLDQSKLEDLIGKYTQFISFPIKLRVPKKEEASEDEDEDEEAEEVDMDGNTEEKEPKVVKESFEYKQVNANKPIWTMNEKELAFEDYAEFYKKAFKQYEDPLHYIHFKASAGTNDFKALLFIPKQATNNQMDPKSRFVSPVKIYVRRVFITDNLPDFLPNYLQFISGIVDADDFPLNVARETLQASSTINQVKNRVKSKCIKAFQDLAINDPELFNMKFWPNFGGSIKLGMIEDAKNKLKLAKLLRFRSSWHDREQDEVDAIDAMEGKVVSPQHDKDILPSSLSTEEKMEFELQMKWEKEAGVVSLSSYVRRMRKEQKSIYYLTGESITVIKRSPYIEQLLSRGYEVLYLVDVHDEYLMQQFTEYEGFKIQSAAKELELEGEDLTELNEQFSPLTVFLKRHFEKYVDSVVLSTRVVSSPGALIASKMGVSGNMERILKSQLNNIGSSAKTKDAATNWQLDMALKSKKTLEINPYHPVVKGLLEKVIYLEDTFDESQPESVNKARERDIVRVCALMYDSISVRSGFGLRDAMRFSKRLDKILAKELGVEETTGDAPIIKSTQKTEKEIKQQMRLLNKEDDKVVDEDAIEEEEL